MQIIFDCLYKDLKDLPEVAVILGIDGVRQAKGKYFPSVEEIVTEVSFYRDVIFDALDFFQCVVLENFAVFDDNPNRI